MLSRLARSEHFKIIIDHKVDVPIGAGFGTSGAAALSLALALNRTLSLGMSNIEAAQVAHVAEVKCRTGLGTVIAETFGGAEIRVKPGGPGIGEIQQMPASDKMVVACLAFRSLSTKESLMDPKTRKRINEFGGILVDRLTKKPEITNFLRFSRRFAEHVDLISNGVRRVLNAADHAGFACSMPMFGDSAFTIVHRELLEDVLRIFREHSLAASIVTSEIDFEGARLLK
jgi:pantoate kinase